MKISKNELNSLIDRIINEAIEDYPFLDDIIVRDKNNNLLKWNGSSFEPYNEPVQAVTATPSYPLGSTAKPGKNVGEIIQSRTGKLYRWNGKSWSAVGRVTKSNVATAPVSVASEPNTSSNLPSEVESEPKVENNSTKDNTSNGTQTYYVHFSYKYLKGYLDATLWIDASSPKEAEDKIKQRVKTYVTSIDIYTI